MTKRGSQDDDLVRGLTGYLETLQLAGVDAIALAVPNEWKPIPAPQPEPTQEETMPKRPTALSGRSTDVLSGRNTDAPEKIALPTEPSTKTDDFRLDLAAADRVATLRQLADQVARCNQCRELAAQRTQTVFGVGNPHSELVFLGEAPGADEDKQGIPFVGRAGKLLTDMIEKGMKLKRDDVYICNILRCRPPGNRNPAPDEAARCRPFLNATLQVIRPKYLCCLGSIAASNLLDSQETIGRLRGRVHDYQGIKVVCTYHPAYLLRNPSAKSAAWDDLKLLMREMGLPVPS